MLTINSLTLTPYDKFFHSYGITWQTKDLSIFSIYYKKSIDDIYSVLESDNEISIDGYKNYVILKDLLPETTYNFYIANDSGECSELFQFKTVSDIKTSFYYFCDSQDCNNYGEWWSHAWKHAVDNYPDSDFYLHGGDIVQESGDEKLWIKMLGINSKYTSYYPVVASAGNHDYWECYLHGNSSTFYKHFNYEIPNQDTSSGIFYSKEINNVTFFVLNSGASIEKNSEQYLWLINELELCKTKWKIVMIHNPLYSPGKYGARPGWNDLALHLRKILNPIFSKYNVDLVLSGHDHIYSKSFPIYDDGSCDYHYDYELLNHNNTIFRIGVNLKGPIHFISGCCGNQNRTCHENIDEIYLKELDEMSDMKYGWVSYSYIEVEENIIYISYISFDINNPDNIEKYNFGIKKQR